MALGTIDQFSNSFGEGQRTSQFIVRGNFVDNAGGADSITETEFLVKSAQYPGSNIGVVQVPYRGRRIKRPGDRVFNEWSISVIMDEGHVMHNKFVGWMNSINPHNNVAREHSKEVIQDWTIYALGPDGIEDEKKSIVLKNAFPTEVGTVDFNWETTDTVAEFSVTMQYDYWTKTGATT